MTESANRRTALSAVLVMGCTLASRILGFVRTAAIGALFGAGGAADVINLIFNIPNNLRKLLAEGALSTAFIPELSRQISEDPKRKKSRELAASILGLQFLIIVPILLISILFPDQVLRIFETFADPEKSALSRVLFRWMMPYILLVSISALMMAVQNTHEHFLIPAITPIVFSLCVIGSLLIGYKRLGALSIAYGVLAGGIAQILVQFPSYRKLGYTLTPQWCFASVSFRRVLRQWGPIVLTSSLFAINNQIAMLLASRLPDKSPSSLSYAIVFFQLPFGVFSASITTVLYPRMSRQASIRDIDALAGSLSFGYRNLWALLLPSAMALAVLGEPIIAVAFQRGAFSREDTILTARVLTAYSIGMPFIGFFNISQRAFYALGELRRPFYCALVAVVIDIILSLLFVFRFNGGSHSLALANSIAFIFAAILQYIILRKSIRFNLDSYSMKTFAKVIAASGAGCLVILAANRFIGARWWSGGSRWENLALLSTIAIIASALILGLYSWMKVETLSIIFKRKK